MSLTLKIKLIIIIGSVVAGAAIVVPTTVVLLNNNNSDEMVFTLLYNAGVMIEAKGLRIYIDPINLPYQNYSDLDADAILITHDHGDHYQYSMVSMLQKENTTNVFPAIMTEAINDHDGMSVIPGDTFFIGTTDVSIKISCFYMYTFAPEPYDPSHPPESNYTSYIIDIDGFTIFHAGDSGDLPEYSELTGTIDWALLPLGPGCQTMYDLEVVNVLETIGPTYFTPIHSDEEGRNRFLSIYESYLTDFTVIDLDNFESYQF